MSVLRALLDEIVKMFAADLWLTLAALLTVGLCALGLRAGLLTAGTAPLLLAGGILGALVLGVVRGARR